MFKSPEQALGFAFRIRDRDVISIPNFEQLGAKIQETNPANRLTQQDLHAQSAFILNFLSRQKEIIKSYAYFLHGTERERTVACASLAKELSAKLKRYNLSEDLLAEAINARNIRKVAAATGLTNYKSWKFRRDLADALEPVRTELMDELWNWLSNTGSK